MAEFPKRRSGRQSPLPIWWLNTNLSGASMLVLDENLPAAQRQLLRKWRIRFRVIGVDVASWGTDDENLIPVLHCLPQPSFFSLDRDFFRPNLAHGCFGWRSAGDRGLALLG